MSVHRLCIFGEVLFDHFPEGRRVLGGAPFNVAWHLQAFGQKPRLISRVGDDPEGDQIRAAMHAWGMDTDALQTDPANPTGRVEVSFADGEPSYDIVHPCAYDRIGMQAAETGCELLYHGSLAVRDTGSRQTLAKLVNSRSAAVFVDVNLRPPWWRKAQVLDLLHNADWVKLSGDELLLLDSTGNSGQDLATVFLKKYSLQGLLLTHGAAGAELFTAAGERFEIRPEKNIPVTDTVGAGDAFAAVTILGLLEGWDMPVTLERAQAFASGIVANRGATVNDKAFYHSFTKQWNPGA